MKLELEINDKRNDGVLVIHALLQKVDKLLKSKKTDHYTVMEIYGLTSFADQLAKAANIRMEGDLTFSQTLNDVAKWKDKVADERKTRR
jgi:U3 small nucleolar RNA-associated protein 14